MDETALDTRPTSVAIVALGPSNHDYIASKSSKKDFLKVDEVWLVNSAINSLRGDKVFIMDDLKRVEKRFPDWARLLRHEKTPIVTSKVYEDYPSAVAYPIDAVCDHFKDDYLTTTVAYMIAYAIFIKVKELYLFGCDYWYPGSKAVEPGMDCVTYYLGIARERNINFRIPQNSVLLDAHMTKFNKEGKRRRPLYGYDYNPGESQARVESGVGSELDHLVAHKAPSRLPDHLPIGVKPDGEDKPAIPLITNQVTEEKRDGLQPESA